VPRQQEIKPRPAKIHVHVRKKADDRKKVDRDFDAVSTLYTSDLGLYGNQEISRIQKAGRPEVLPNIRDQTLTVEAR
jgi:hypothetical protein